MDEKKIVDRSRKGRGAVSNRAGRFERETKERIADGWEYSGQQPEDELLRTEVFIDKSKSAITRNQSPDLPFNQSLNAYRGCEHGCVYCFARPSHAYLGHSPGLDFETKLYAKPEAAELLRRELSKPGYRPEVLAIGTNTDPYQPIERHYRITRSVLAVLSEFHHPVAITTKSARILEDIDLLADMAKRQLVGVYISVTTLDSHLARIMEPRASAPHLRLQAMAELNKAGIPAGISLAPIIPAINDTEIEQILQKAKEAGAKTAFWTLVRLARELKELFEEWLFEHFPDRKEKALSLIRQCFAGNLSLSDFERRMSGQGPYADLIAQRFKLATAKLQMNQTRTAFDFSGFRVPKKLQAQGDLFNP